MTIIQLKYFCAACEFENITRAAEQLHISQPAISGAIKALENEFKLTLVSRNGRGFKLTQPGITFRRIALEYLNQADNTELMLHSLVNNSGLLKIGTSPLLAMVVLHDIFSKFNKMHRDIAVSLVEKEAIDLSVDLQKSMLDLIIVPDSIAADHGFSYIPFAQTGTTFCVPSSHELAGRRSISIDMICDFPIITRSDMFSSSVYLLKLYRSIGREPNVVLRTNQISLMLDFVRDGIAYTYLLRGIADKFPGISSLHMEGVPDIKICLAWQKDRYISEEMTAMISFVRKITQNTIKICY